MINIRAGSTSQTIDVFIQDSTSTTGAGKTGLTDATAGWKVYWRRAPTGTPTSISLVSQTVGGAWTSGGFVATDATNKPGEYRFDIPDTVISLQNRIYLSFSGPTGVAYTLVGIDCIDLPANVVAMTSGVINRSVLHADTGLQSVRSATCQSGSTSSTARLDASASLTTDFYKDDWVYLTGGLGQGQMGLCTAYNGTTKDATITPNWLVTPDNTTTFAVVPRTAISRVIDLTNLPAITNNWLTAAGIATAALNGKGDWNIGKTGYALTAGEHTTIASDTQGGLTAQGYSGTRAAYLDKLNITGNVASSAEVTAIQNNTRTVIVVPEVIERPDASTVPYKIRLYLYDEVGNMEAPDSTPTVAIANQSGTDLSARLGAATNTSTGVYEWTYTADVAHNLDQLLWVFTVVEGGATRLFGRSSLLVDNTAVDFTSTDRTNLNSILTKVNPLPTDPADASDIAASFAALPTTAQIADKILGRNLNGGADGGRTVQDALRISRNKVVIDANTNTITVYKEDDTTIAWTGVLVAAAPASTGWISVDPA